MDPVLPPPPKLPGARSEHYALFRSIGIYRYDQLGLAEPGRLYARLVVEVARGKVEVRLPTRRVVAAWVVRSQSFADKVWSLLEPEQVEITLFSLPGEKRSLPRARLARGGLPGEKRPNDPGPGGTPRRKTRLA